MTICCISFHPCRSITKQIWPCHKNSQGQPSVIIWINLVVLAYPMLYTKFQCHRPLGSEKGDFWRFLQYMDLEAILVMWPGTFEQIFIPISHGGSIWNLASIGLSVFWGKEVLKSWIWVTLDQVQWMTLTFDIHIGSCTHLVNCIYQLWHHRLQ